SYAAATRVPVPLTGYSSRSINTICEQIGRWHDAEHADPARHISPLRPHDLRHTFGFTLVAVTGNDAYELCDVLGGTSRAPAESTIRRTLQRLDAAELDRLLGTWAQTRTAATTGTVSEQPGRRPVAVDGKTLRGRGRPEAQRSK